MLLAAWATKGRPEEVVSQKTFGALLAGLGTDDQGRVNKWFPLVITARRPNKWDLGTLRSVLAWDDPVVMLGTLVRSNPGAWWGVLKDAEENPCTEAQEEAIRCAYSDLIGAQATVIDDPRHVDHQLWTQNKGMRFNT